MESLDVRLRFGATKERAVGRLAVVGRDVVFQFEEAFVGRPLPLSPLRLPVRPEVQVFDRSGNLEVFGVFEDAMPDSWGRRLVECYFQRTMGHPPQILERLAYVGERGMGALTFHPPLDATDPPDQDLDLAGLAVKAWDFDEAQIEDALPDLRRLAGTSGGARPKILVGLPESKSSRKGVLPGDGELPSDYAHWIVKFNTRADGPDSGPLEQVYALMAAEAKAEVPEHRLIETSQGRFFATRRFDRALQGRRMHLHSAAGLLHADFRIAGDEYDLLFRLLEKLTRDYAQKLELFRRVSLNVLACNRDDHLKNFAFLMDDAGAWRLSPLFDFTFHTGPNGWHTLTVAGEGRHPRKEHLLALARQADVKARDAKKIIEEVRSAVEKFGSLANRWGISKSTINTVKARIGAIER